MSASLVTVYIKMHLSKKSLCYHIITPRSSLFISSIEMGNKRDEYYKSIIFKTCILLKENKGLHPSEIYICFMISVCACILILNIYIGYCVTWPICCLIDIHIGCFCCHTSFLKSHIIKIYLNLKGWKVSKQLQFYRKRNIEKKFEIG